MRAHNLGNFRDVSHENYFTPNFGRTAMFHTVQKKWRCFTPEVEFWFAVFHARPEI